LSALVGAVLLLGGPGWGQDGKDKDKDGKPGNLGALRDVPLFNRVLEARKEYAASLGALREHYIAVGDVQKARWAEDELMQFHRMSKQAFVLDLVVPPPSLKGTQNDPRANELFRQAKGFKDRTSFGSESVDNQRRAELLFHKILTKYPHSDKISETAYQLGDLYESRSYQQYALAAAFFERCYQWNPRTQNDARLRAARLYERQLNERQKAAEIYKEIQTHETDEKRIEEARRRIQELSNRR
jgi:tetratricopeptide (TPR) repeat protein